jgi:type II secretory pathway component PulM
MKLSAASELPSVLSAQFARVSPRERRLLAVLGVIALFVGAFESFDLYQTAQARKIAARAALDSELQAAKAVRADGVGGQLTRQRQEIQAWSWQASSAPVGRVLAQDRIAALAAHAGMSADTEIKAADKIEHVGGIDLVRVDIDAPFTWAGFSGLLSGLAGTGKAFMVDALTIQDAPKPRLKMTLKLPMTATPEPAA